MGHLSQKKGHLSPNVPMHLTSLRPVIMRVFSSKMSPNVPPGAFFEKPSINDGPWNDEDCSKGRMETYMGQLTLAVPRTMGSRRLPAFGRSGGRKRWKFLRHHESRWIPQQWIGLQNHPGWPVHHTAQLLLKDCMRGWPEFLCRTDSRDRWKPVRDNPFRRISRGRNGFQDQP